MHHERSQSSRIVEGRRSRALVIWPGRTGHRGGMVDKNPLAPRPTHHPARAKRIIFLFMHGGPSQVDTFDYKPRLSATTARISFRSFPGRRPSRGN